MAAALTSTPTSTAASEQPGATETPGGPTLSVNPGSGPVGTIVTITGTGFPQSATVYFYCPGVPASRGGAPPTLGQVTIKSAGGRSFRTAWPVPSMLDPLQGEGGGPTPMDGSWWVAVTPPYAAVPFRVTR
jgi:hypothetical protein